MNIFIDVTNSCTSVQNTGTQRVTRKMFAELNRRAPTQVRPICWNRLGNFYTNLGDKESRFLTQPFNVRSRPMAHPEWYGQDPLSEFGRLITRQRVNLEAEIGTDDVFFVPEFFRDRRCTVLRDFICRIPARTVAIFHDAADLRLAAVPGDRQERSRPYLESLARFDLVICVSEEARDDLRYFWKKYGCKAAETRVEPWPGELEGAAKPGSGKIKNDLIVYVSSFQHRKNHLGLLHAAEKLWQQGLQFELHLIGRNVGLPLNKIVREIWKLRMRGRPLRWLRHVNDETLLRAYRECRFTVYPSLMEGYGLPIAESLLHGKPCVCGDNGALGEVARGGGCLIVDQTDPAALADGIRRLLSDQDLFSRLTAEARARQFRSWTDYMDRLFEHLRFSSKSPQVPMICRA